MTTTHDVPMPEPVGSTTYFDLQYGDVVRAAYTADQVRDTAIKYADARCAKLQTELAISEDMGKRAMEGIAFAHKFNEAMGNEMRAAGCIFDTEAMKVRNERAEKAEAERDALAEKVKDIDQCSATTQALIAMLIERDQLGRQKYGATLDRTDLTHEQWLQHMAEEMLDGAGYALAAIRTNAAIDAAGDQP